MVDRECCSIATAIALAAATATELPVHLILGTRAYFIQWIFITLIFALIRNFVHQTPVPRFENYKPLHRNAKRDQPLFLVIPYH